MITREILDKVLPDIDAVLKAIRHIDPNLKFVNNMMILSWGLRWLADATERSRFTRYDDLPWKNPSDVDYDPTGMVWPISMCGLEYKDSLSYMTAQGWPSSGPPCWFVRIESGYREIVGALTPELAIARAIVVMRIIELQQPTAPKKRVNLITALERIGEELRTGEGLPSPLVA